MRDLDYYRNLRRPAADVAADDEVAIKALYNDRIDWGRVVKTGRVWLTIKTPGHSEQQFHRSTQMGKDEHYRFVTPEQYEFDQQVKAAEKALSDRRISMTGASLSAAQVIAMADLLAALDQPAKEA